MVTVDAAGAGASTLWGNGSGGGGGGGTGGGGALGGGDGAGGDGASGIVGFAGGGQSLSLNAAYFFGSGCAGLVEVAASTLVKITACTVRAVA